ncbi:hypothetical protein F4779DRAFT_588594 [Xylariaceae sp. FL0662B]|nr:hypothetical protein F4779DRAFT_588594 [Xylariaceae sp. FL0662B]
MREAQSSTTRVCGLVYEVLHGNQDSASRISSLGTEGVSISELVHNSNSSDDRSSIRSSTTSSVALFLGSMELAIKFTVEQDP